MRTRLSAPFILGLCLYVPAVFPAEINVPPGADTLASAIASAANGDTLVLQEGAYGGLATVDKSLVIRAVDRHTEALVSDELTIDGADIDVTIQGLTFTSNLVVARGAHVKILENHWLTRGLSVSNYKTSEGDGALLIVGNVFESGSIGDVYSDGAYIAGNILKNSGSSQITVRASAWVVGNEVQSETAYPIFISGSGITVRVLGNRLSCSGRIFVYCVYADISGLVHIANNLITLIDPDPATASYPWQYGISVLGTGYGRIYNNVIRGEPLDATRQGNAILASAADIRGNIIVDYKSINATLSIAGSGVAFTHNLCFNNSSDCPAGDGNLNVDPQFVDMVDYRLATTSPAIDAGPLDYQLADQDRTRNDMGIYGGPWSIGQFDAQRHPDRLAPYVYPLLTRDEAYGDGVLEVQAIGVARLR